MKITATADALIETWTNSLEPFAANLGNFFRHSIFQANANCAKSDIPLKLGQFVKINLGKFETKRISERPFFCGDTQNLFGRAAVYSDRFALHQ